MEDENVSRKYRVLELFSGIGGLHWALKVSSVPYEVVAAMEINPIVVETYKHNFSETNVVRKNLEGITTEEINKLGIDAIIMSPPCQPFCRTGNHLDTQDKRTGPLSHLTEILPNIDFKYIFVENVQGFETSTARDNLLKALTEKRFQWQEFMLTPKTIGIPNSRLRYYLIGKHTELQWPFTPQDCLMTEVPNWHAPHTMPFRELKSQQDKLTKERRERWESKCRNQNFEILKELPFCVGDIIENELPDEAIEELRISDAVLSKYFQAMDIVTPLSSSTCCFTKGYGHFVKGTGSVLDLNYNKCDSNEKTLRYFTPKEISRLMCYPEEFDFPIHLSVKQKYKSLGNSVNVYVVAVLFTLLFK